MATATIVQIVNDASIELGFEATTAAIQSTEQKFFQMGALLNALGQILVKRNEWRALKLDYTFNTANGVSAYPLPVDFDRIVNQTSWDSGRQSPVFGPTSSQYWQLLKNAGTANAMEYRFRLRGTNFVVDPTPTDVRALSFEYVSNAWVRDGDTPTSLKDRATKDIDIPVFDSRLLTEGLKLFFVAGHGFDATKANSIVEQLLSMVIGHDEGAPVLNYNNTTGVPFISESNIQEGNWLV
jgi:hypothetical protein